MNEPENITVNCEECGAEFQTAKGIHADKELCSRCITPKAAICFKADICFRNELHNRIDYFRKEFNLTYSEAISGLEIVKFDILQEMLEENEEV